MRKKRGEDGGRMGGGGGEKAKKEEEQKREKPSFIVGIHGPKKKRRETHMGEALVGICRRNQQLKNVLGVRIHSAHPPIREGHGRNQ